MGLWPVCAALEMWLLVLTLRVHPHVLYIDIYMRSFYFGLAPRQSGPRVSHRRPRGHRSPDPDCGQTTAHGAQSCVSRYKSVLSAGAVLEIYAWGTNHNFPRARRASGYSCTATGYGLES